MAFLKRIGKATFSEKNWKNALALKSKKVQVMFGKRLFWHYCFQLSFVYKSVPQIFFNLFCSGNQRLSLHFLGNEVDFRYIINVSQISWRKTSKNFKKLRHGFVDERAPITTTLIPFCHWKTFVSFYLRKKRHENAFLRIILKYRKNRTEKQFIPSKTTINWLFNDIWCCFLIDIWCFWWCLFNWKIGVS